MKENDTCLTQTTKPIPDEICGPQLSKYFENNFLSLFRNWSFSFTKSVLNWKLISFLACIKEPQQDARCRPMDTPCVKKRLEDAHVSYLTSFSWCKYRKVLFISTCRFFQIAYEGDFWCLCTVAFWLKVYLLISNTH